MADQSIIFIVGPTAVGKTEVALLLAQRLSGEIISCDAMQVYKEINIASAKPSQKELSLIKHHCINMTSVTEDFNVGRYRDLALQSINEVQSQGKNVIFCGGSGMYMTVMLDGIFEQVSRNPLLREKLHKDAIVRGIGALHRQLSELDPLAAGKIHPNDAKRIIRALEVSLTSGVAMSQMQTQREGLWGRVPIRIFALTRSREELYQRVEERVERMFEQGLVDEIKSILELNLSLTAKTLIGIPEVSGFLRGEYDVEQTKYLMKMNTRHFVKRQLTWLRRDKRVEWINIEKHTAKSIAETIIKEIKSPPEAQSSQQ